MNKLLISLRSCEGRKWLAVLLFAAGGSFIRAQDVSVSPIQWTEPRDPPNEMPALRRTPRFDFPTELRPTPDLHYVIIEFVLDPKARPLAMLPHSTTPALTRVYLDAMPFQFSPGKREGKPVNTAVTLALLFNPASAPAAGPEATPRLLDVSLVQVPRPKSAKPDDELPEQVIFADITVDERGSIAAIRNAPPALAVHLGIAAKNWKFAPARRGGQPVSADLRVPFVLRVDGDNSTGRNRTVPRVISQAPPVYPFLMRASGMRGEVLVDFVVDIEGRVRNAFVVRTLNPAFDDPAMEAVRKWRFEPGRLAERPVNTHMQVPIVFSLDDQAGGGGDGLEVRRSSDWAKLPEELRYDVPPRPTGMVRPVYPYAALQAGREGKAVVSYLINESGRVVEARVREATAPEFGHALLAAVERFVYEPALKKGRPCQAVIAFAQEFRRAEEHQMTTPDELALLRREQKSPQTIIGPAELDTPPVPLSQQPPAFPLSQLKEGRTGEATVEFLVDEDGRARLPRIVTATNDAFGYAAVQSIANWRFEPPRRGRKPVVVRLQVPVGFALAPGTKTVQSGVAVPGPAAVMAKTAAAASPAPPATAPTGNLAINSAATIQEWAPAVPPPGWPADRSGTATVRIVVDETGAISAARVLDESMPALGRAAVTAVKGWKFKPAVDDGKPVATCLDVPFVFSPVKTKPGLLPPAFLMPTPAPRTAATKKSAPLGEYPESLLGRGIPGSLVFECRVGADGRITGLPTIRSASHVDFVLPALGSFTHWEFQPARQGDLPIAADVRGEVAYEDTPTKPAAALAANGITAPDGSAPGRQPQPRIVVEPVWPLDLLLQGEGGAAAVTFTVEPNGRVNDVAVKSASHPAFGAALAAAMEMWLFDGAIEDGRRVPVSLLKRAEFKAVPLGASDRRDPLQRLVALEREKAIRGGAGLDENLTPLYRVPPVLSPAQKTAQASGKAVIAFVIDQDGRARLPQIVSATSPEYGWAAVTAVGQWVFKAPTRGGQPTDVKVQLPLQF